MNRLLLLFILSTLGGCSFFKTSPDASNVRTVLQQTKSPEESNNNTLTKETLYELLLAEFSGYRGHYDIALENYTDQAKKTKDPYVTERAYQLASLLNSSDEAKEMALLWVEIAPKNILAHQAITIQLAKQGDIDQAYQHMSYILKHDKNLTFEFLINATNITSNNDRENLIIILKKLSQNYPDQTQLTYIVAQLLEKNGKIEDALAVLRTIPTEKKTTKIVLAELDILKNTSQVKSAIQLAEEQLKVYPDDKTLRLAYAKLLISQENFIDAKKQLIILEKQYPDDVELKLISVLVSLENKEWDNAINNLNQIIEQSYYTDGLYYYLGLAYTGKGQYQLALGAFSQVTSGDNFLASKAQIAKLLTDQKQINQLKNHFANARKTQPEYVIPLYLLEIEALINAQQFKIALAIANRAIKENPNDTNLLFSRSMIAERMNNIKQAEQDLRKIIKLESKNSAAINALGYILADKTTRYKESIKLIQQAYEINPDNPAILDSMGWINFRLGKLEEALHYTQKAYEIFDDPEVAAHLGEILWVSGQRQQAKDIWNKALKKAPEHPILTNTIQRLTGNKEQ